MSVMLCKISFKNMRRSIRDYAIYFFTLALGVAIFYTFNAIGTQAAALKMNESQLEILSLLKDILSGVSVFVAIILALLIIYASRFLMKRRNREFALYMLLGLGKGRISFILLTETIIIGIGSLLVGLLIGVGISQFMSAFVASMFEADMSAFTFTISSEAIVKTIVFFAIMYLVVMIFNSTAVTRMKLIDLIRSGKRSEIVKIGNPFISTIIFLVAAGALGYAYYIVSFDYYELTKNKLILTIVLGGVSTFLIFFSVSNFFLKIFTCFKKSRYKGLNTFTFRQLSSKVNTMIVSNTVISLMLFISICAFSYAFTIKGILAKNINLLCPADAQIDVCLYTLEGNEYKPCFADIEKLYAETGLDISEGFKDVVHFATYEDATFNISAFFGSNLEEVKKNFPYLDYTAPESIVKLSDYNRLMTLYGKEHLSLDKDEFIPVCNYLSSKELRNRQLESNNRINVFGRELTAAYPTCVDGFIELSATMSCTGIFVVDDDVVDEAFKYHDYFIGNFDARTKSGYKEVEAGIRENFETAKENYKDLLNREYENTPVVYISLLTKSDLHSDSVGISAILTFLGLYMGLVFLLESGAVLSLKSLSECVDSLPRYDMLRKLGADERSITGSLFVQLGIYFLLPLLLAIIHSIFGLKFGANLFGSQTGDMNIGSTLALTTLVLLLIYGAYFLITFLNSKYIIKDRL